MVNSPNVVVAGVDRNNASSVFFVAVLYVWSIMLIWGRRLSGDACATSTELGTADVELHGRHSALRFVRMYNQPHVALVLLDRRTVACLAIYSFMADFQFGSLGALIFWLPGVASWSLYSWIVTYV